MVSERVPHGFHPSRSHLIIGITERHSVTDRGLDPDIAGKRLAPSGRGVDDAKVRDSWGITPGKMLGAIRRSIVHNKKFPGLRPLLLRQGLELAPKRRYSIVAGHHHTQLHKLSSSSTTIVLMEPYAVCSANI
jgi:hypothetical protein